MKYLLSCSLIALTLLTSPAMADIGNQEYSFRNQTTEQQSNHYHDYDDRLMEAETELHSRCSKNIQRKWHA